MIPYLFSIVYCSTTKLVWKNFDPELIDRQDCSRIPFKNLEKLFLIRLNSSFFVTTYFEISSYYCQERFTPCLSYWNQVNWFCMYLLSLHSDSTRLEPKNPYLTRWSPSPWCCRQILSVHATQNTVTFFVSDVLYTSDRVSGTRVTRVTHVFVMWWLTWCDVVTFMWQS